MYYKNITYQNGNDTNNDLDSLGLNNIKKIQK